MSILEAENELDWEEDLRRLNEPGESIPADEVLTSISQRIATARKNAGA